MTPLRQRMIEDMQLRNLSTGTQRAYLHYITGLARFYQTSPNTSPEHPSLEELREYQLYMINERQYSPESVNHFVVSAKCLYNVTLETPWPERRSSAMPCSPQTSGSPQRDRSPGVLPACLHHSKSPRLDDRLRSRSARLRGGVLASGRYRFPTQADPDSTGQRQEGSICHAFRPPAGSAAMLVALPAPCRTAAEGHAGGLAFPRMAQRPPYERRFAAGRLPGSGARGRA
jgi:hypothetical protein